MKNICILKKNILTISENYNNKIQLYLLRGGDVTHDDGVVLVQPGLVQHAAPRGHVDGAVVVGLQDAETPAMKIFLAANQKISELQVISSYQWKYDSCLNTGPTSLLSPSHRPTSLPPCSHKSFGLETAPTMYYGLLRLA